MKPSDITIIKHEVEGTLIPYGQVVNLIPGTEVLVTQALGGTYTLNVNGNLVRIDGKDAAAIGREPSKPPKNNEKKPKGKFNGSLDKNLLWQQLKTCYDPEIPVNIVDLGLVYDLELTKQDNGYYHVGVQMTLTAPGCGMGPVIAADAESKLQEIDGVAKVDVVVVFDPPWHADLMTESAKLELGLL
jgi:probable FeS assembly SUF system protein SufT